MSGAPTVVRDRFANERRFIVAMLGGEASENEIIKAYFKFQRFRFVGEASNRRYIALIRKNILGIAQ